MIFFEIFNLNLKKLDLKQIFTKNHLQHGIFKNIFDTRI